MKKSKTQAKPKNLWSNEMIKNANENNVCSFVGYVKKAIYTSDNVAKYSVEIARETPNKKIAKTWLTVVSFEEELEEGKFYLMSLVPISNTYNGDFKTEFILEEVKEL